MFDTISQSVRVEKPDFVQLVGQLPAGTTAGCKWCRKTIFFNGSFWNHIDGDQHKCERSYGSPHDVEEVGEEEVRVGVSFWTGKPTMVKAPVYRCSACMAQKVARNFSGNWFPDLGYDCAAKVATPFRPEVKP